MLDKQETRDLIRAKEQASQCVLVGRQAERENPWLVTPHEAFYISVEPLGAVVCEEQKTRNALPPGDPGLAVDFLETKLFCSQRVLCSF